MTADADEHTDYLSYLLRLWRVDEAPTGAAEDVIWRASLESPFTGERMSFACLEDLCDFLREQIGVSPVSSKSSKGGENEKQKDRCSG